jgi:D-alanine-D-alanine ligase
MEKFDEYIEIAASTRPGLSSMSKKSQEVILAILSKKYTRVGISIVNNLADLDKLIAKRPDMVFMGMKFIPADPLLGHADPNKIWLSEYLDKAGIRYTGSGPEAIELELNKELAKQRIADVGLATPRFQVVLKTEVLRRESVTLNYPLFVKPINRGGGAGVDQDSLAYNFHQLSSKVQSISASLQSDSLIEEYLPGREFSVGVLRLSRSDQYSIMPLEIIAPPDQSGARFLSSQIKSENIEYTLAVTDDALKAKINALAMSAFRALGARDYGRIDIRLDGFDEPHFLEANLLPSLLEGYGNFPKTCLLNIGLDHGPMIMKIVNLAVTRSLLPGRTFQEATSIYRIVPPLAIPGIVFEPI